ncbi:MAG: DUF402 domain-containing protein [Lachnospiraceae bacterium]|nr:DUF402 domain-containing protein [Lachnospiraceae bacterium]
MENLKIFRKRLIPKDYILLDKDLIIERDDEHILTSWKTIRPKEEFDHGTSCYFLNEGIKVSKFYREDGELLYWYCDIVQYDFSEDGTELVVTDLLADVIIYPSGRWKVVDLDELADAKQEGLITDEQLIACLRQLNNLLSIISRDKFDKFQACLDYKGL